MPYFPTEKETKYYCPNCNQWFIPGDTSCLILHPPGSCCHHFEKSVTPPKNEDIDSL